MAKTGELPKTKSPHFSRGLVFGAFDPLHFGHIRLFKKASEVCDSLYACTESDKIIKRDKGRDPFTTEQNRVEDLLGVKYLDDVAIRTDEMDRGYWAEHYVADVLFLGGDWKGKKWEGEKLGIPIVYFPYTNEITSTFIRNELPRNISEDGEV